MVFLMHSGDPATYDIDETVTAFIVTP